MITRIKIEGFKSLESVDLQLGRVNLFVGTNASGKSNFLDALRVLQGLAYGFTVAEVLDGKPKSARSEVWDPLRGGSENVRFVGRDERLSEPMIRFGRGRAEPLFRFSVTIQPRDKDLGKLDYMVAISPREECVREESLSVNGTRVFDSTEIPVRRDRLGLSVRFYPDDVGRLTDKEFEKSRPVAQQVGRSMATELWDEELNKVLDTLARSLSNFQRIDPSPAVLRSYSQARLVDRMGEHGENFAALVNAIKSDPETRSAYISWLRQLTPSEVEDVEVLEGALKEPLFALRERGKTKPVPAPILSDGTLRFAAIAATFFQPSMPDLVTIEEIDNGIHSSRLRLLVEMLKQQSEFSGTQVLATTHSPVLLTWLQPEDFQTTFLCQRDEETGASRIRPLSEVPHFLDLIRRESIVELVTEGWLEAVP